MQSMLKGISTGQSVNYGVLQFRQLFRANLVNFPTAAARNLLIEFAVRSSNGNWRPLKEEAFYYVDLSW